MSSFKKFESQLEQDLPNVITFGKKLLGSILKEDVFSEEEIPKNNQTIVARSNDIVICATCQGKKKLGLPGNEINCPICAGCKTCGGTGKLGASNHEIDCPICGGK
jgi:DNA-directed RNA polymerase subunit RPC12/RpoP